MLLEIGKFIDGLPAVQRTRGVFAFATSAGIAALASSEVWQQIHAAQDVKLIIGFDAITNASALEALRRMGNGLPDGSLLALDPAHPAQLAHPKFLLLELTGGEAIVCVASNNLTGPALEMAGALVNNEAYCIARLSDPAAVRETFDEFDQFAAAWDAYLTDMESDLVDGWATDNDRRQRESVRRAGAKAAKTIIASTGAVTNPNKDVCLVMRTPKERGGTQIGVTARIAQQYFGTTHAQVTVEYLPYGEANPPAGEAVEKTLGGPRGGGNVGLELRGVGVAFRESNEPFDENARPIVIMREIAPSYYRYTVLLPQAHGPVYRSVDDWLQDPTTAASRQSPPGGQGSPVLRVVAPTAVVGAQFPVQAFPLA